MDCTTVCKERAARPLAHPKPILMGTGSAKTALPNQRIADTLEQLDADTETLLSIGREHLCQSSVLRYQQEDGLNTVLPYGLRRVKALRTLTTESAAVLMPYRVQEIQDPGGLSYGINAISRNLLICDRKRLISPHGFYLGVSGSGKSMGINEWYAKDTSKKIRAVFRNKGMSGQRLAVNAPYGYIKGEDGHLLVDEETAPVVELIFQLCVEGNGPGKIARMLKEREIPTPGTITFQRTGQTSRYFPDDPCRWNAATVQRILEQDTYLGRTTNFKTTKLSYKSKKTVINSPDKWAVFEGTHEAIIDKETWEIVQKSREHRRRPTKMGEMGLFSGLAYCADCGAKLYHHRSITLTKEQESYICSNYQSRKKCTAHYIRAIVLEQLVLQNLQRVVAYAQEDEDEFVRRVMENKTAVQRAEQEQAKRRLEKQERRISELDRIIQQLYEDRVSGALSAERFAKLSGGYEKEQEELKQSAKELQTIVNTIETQAVNVQSFLKIVRKYTAPTELTPALLREFVEKIVVHAPDKSSGHRTQRIDVHYNFIGEIDFSPEYSQVSRQTTA